MKSFIVFVYDSQNSQMVNKCASKRLFWRQNSVFDGKLLESEYNLFLGELKDILTSNIIDRYMIYKFNKFKGLDKIVLGEQKLPDKQEFIL